MKKINLLIAIAALYITSGCAIHHNIPAVTSDIPAYNHNAKKIPLKVAVIVPDENYVMTKSDRGSLTETIPAGQLINRFSRNMFPYIFREVDIVKNISYSSGANATIIPTIHEFRFYHEQVALGFGLKFHADVSLKGVVTDEKGSPIWEQVVNAKKTSRSVVSPIIPMEQLKGEALSEAVAEAFKELVREMELSREIIAYASSKNAPVMAESAKKGASNVSAKAAIESTNLPPSRPDTYAVVIGIDYKERQDIPNLQYASQDARNIYAILTDPRYGGVPKENAVLLLNEKATRNEMVTALRKMKTWDGYIYVYYSGHGAPKTKGDKFMDAYLVPSDAAITDPEAMEDTSIKVSYLQELIDTSNAKGVMLALDACFTGGGKSIVPKGGKPLVGMLVRPDLIKPSGTGRVIITSSATNQQSWEDESELKGGIFSHYLLEGLRGKTGKDIWVKINDLADYIKENVPKAARKLKGVEQNPQVSGSGDFSVTRNWERASVMDVEIARAKLKDSFEKGIITAEQLSKAMDEMKSQKKSKTLEAYLEGKIDEKKFGELY